MSRNSDLYSSTLDSPLENEGGSAIGKTIINYEISRYRDVKNLVETNSYIVTCTQRIIIPNENIYELSPGVVNSFQDYPALLRTKIKPFAGSHEATFSLIGYSPKTLNTSILSDHSNMATDGGAFTRQHTTGSSTAQTNSYGGSASVGFSPEGLTGGGSANYEHSTTKTQSIEDGTTVAKNHDDQHSISNSMSIKDWGSYAVVNTDNLTASWVWGQEYPWDVIQYRSVDENGDIELPQFVKDRLYDGKQIYPPTQLSLFGIDFVAKATWLIVPEKGNFKPFEIRFQHEIEYCKGSHRLDKSNLSQDADSEQTSASPKTKLLATLTTLPNPIVVISDDLNCDLLSLDPITELGSSNGAVVGFAANKFEAEPAPGKMFKIVSGSNNLRIAGRGFDAPMKTNFSDGPVEMTVSFKITDDENDYTLFLKHWKTSTVGCLIKIKINGVEESVMTKHVDSRETEGGENNLMSIVLRNKDYSASDYYDYLKMGLNTISISVSAETEPSVDCGYALRALAIG